MSLGGLAGFNIQRVRELRVERRLTQRQFADILGVHHQTVIAWECGKTKPEGKTGKKIAAFFGLDLADLLEPIDHSTCLLAELRLPTGLSQRAATQTLGWPPDRLAYAERGTRRLTPDQQHALADLYQLDATLIADAARRTFGRTTPYPKTTLTTPESGVYTLSHARAHLNTLIRNIHKHGPIRIGAYREAQAVLLSADDYDQLCRDAGRPRPPR